VNEESKSSFLKKRTKKLFFIGHPGAARMGAGGERNRRGRTGRVYPSWPERPSTAYFLAYCGQPFAKIEKSWMAVPAMTGCDSGNALGIRQKLFTQTPRTGGVL
jgi:hypothetical protein